MKLVNHLRVSLKQDGDVFMDVADIGEEFIIEVYLSGGEYQETFSNFVEAERHYEWLCQKGR